MSTTSLEFNQANSHFTSYKPQQQRSRKSRHDTAKRGLNQFLRSVDTATLQMFAQTVFSGEGLLAQGTRVILDLQVDGSYVSLVIPPPAATEEFS